MKEVSENLPEQLEYVIVQCKVALHRIRILVIGEGFSIQGRKSTSSRKLNWLFIANY